MNSDIFFLLAADSSERRALLITTLERAGAITPATARPFEEFDVVADDVWDALVREGRIREGRPGFFYVFEGAGRASPRERLVKMVVFYTLILAIPIILILLSKRG